MKLKKMLALAMAATMMLGMVACGQAEGGTFPDGKQITIVVPYDAGGASDITARIFATELEKAIDTSVVVTNVTGASGAVGLEQVRNSKADGYTIAYMPVESTMIKALGFTDLSTDDFRFIGRAMTIPAAITVRADSPWQTFDEFLADAKANPESIQVGNSGTGSIWHIAAASVEKECGVEFTHVPFDGAAPAITALLGDNIQAVAVSPSEVQSNVDSGDFRVLTVLGEEHSSVVPDVDTATEMGVNVTVQGWGGFAVPKDTPDEVVAILEAAAKTAINSEALKEVLAERGFEHAYLSGSEMDELAAGQLADYAELIPALGIVTG